MVKTISPWWVEPSSQVFQHQWVFRCLFAIISVQFKIPRPCGRDTMKKNQKKRNELCQNRSQWWVSKVANRSPTLDSIESDSLRAFGVQSSTSDSTTLGNQLRKIWLWIKNTTSSSWVCHRETRGGNEKKTHWYKFVSPHFWGHPRTMIVILRKSTRTFNKNFVVHNEMTCQISISPWWSGESSCHPLWRRQFVLDEIFKIICAQPRIQISKHYYSIFCRSSLESQR